MGWDDSEQWKPRDTAGSAFVLLAAGLWWVATSTAAAVLAVLSLASRPHGRASRAGDEI